jgi:fatty acid desaturase
MAMPENYDDFDQREEFEARDERDDDFRRDEHIIRRAKDAVRGPAIGLLIASIIGLLWSGYWFFAVNHPAFDGGWNQSIENEMKDPKKSDAEKKEFKQTMDSMKQPAKTTIFALGAVSILACLLTILAAIMMFNLKGRGLAYLASIITAIPLMYCCCFLGMPFAIWSLMVLGRPEVKAGYAAARGER